MFDWISYVLINEITNDFEPLSQGIEYEVDSILKSWNNPMC